MRKSAVSILCLASYLLLGHVAAAQTDAPPTVEGEWEVVSAEPLVSTTQKDLGHRLSIVRSGDGYQVKWVDGPRATGASYAYTGSSVQIVYISNEPVGSGNWVPGEQRGDEPPPATLGQELAGETWPQTTSYTLSSDGETLERRQDAIRVFWKGGHYSHYEIIRGYGRWTFRRVAKALPAELVGNHAVPADCRNPKDLCQGNLVAMTYFCGGSAECSFACCPKGLPYLSHCDCKCHATPEFECPSYSKAQPQPPAD